MPSNRTFHEPRSAVEESEMLENALPRSKRSVNKWTLKVFGEWQAGRTSKKAFKEESESAVETSQIQDLRHDGRVSKLLAEEVHYGSMQRHRRKYCTMFPNKLFWNKDVELYL